VKPNREENAHLISISRLIKRGGIEVSVQGFRGSVRATTAEDFQLRLAEAGERSPYLVVNLADIDYIGSVGLGALVVQARVQERAGGWLRLIQASPAVAMILEISEVARVLPHFSGEEDALRDLPFRAA
jgi:anti-anti-sigma factor